MMNGLLENWLDTQLFQQVPCSIAVIDRDYSIVRANRSFQTLFGRWKNRHCYEAYKGTTDPCQNCLASRTFQDGRVRSTDEKGVNRRGDPAHYVVHVAPLVREGGEIPYVIEMCTDITERIRIRQEHQIIFDRVPCYITVVDRDLKVVRANKLFRDTFGEPGSRRCYELYKDRDVPCRHCPAAQVFSDRRPHSSEHKGQDKDGHEAHFFVNAAPLWEKRDGVTHVVVMSVDVTLARTLESEIGRLRSIHRSVLAAALDAIVATDDRLRVALFNPAAERLFGCLSNDVLGRSIQELGPIPGELTELVDDAASAFVLPETSVLGPAGEEIPTRFSGVVLRDDEGAFLGKAAFFHDLREIKRLEKEKLENERLAVVGQTVTQLSHGIKNILSGVQGGLAFVGWGSESGNRAETAKGVAMLERNFQRITTLVKGFLSFARKQNLHVEEVDPVDIAQEVYDLYRGKAEENKISLRLETVAQVARANMDATDIHTCLANLVHNAIDACTASRKQDCSVVLKVRDEDDTLVFDVIDTGTGIDEDVSERIFKSIVTSKGTAGNGLGLLVTKKLVVLHGGDIFVESERGQGTHFRLEFPRASLPQSGDRGKNAPENDHDDDADKSSPAGSEGR